MAGAHLKEAGSRAFMGRMDETAVLMTRGVELTTSFEAFFDAEAARLFRALRLVAGSAHEAEELMQEAFVRLWERWDRVHAMEDRAGYLYRTAMNLHRSAHRRALRSAKRVIHPAPADDPVIAAEARDALVRWLAGLTPRQREAVVLTQLSGFDVPRAAKAMRVKDGTVHVLLSQARASLRNVTGEAP